MVVRRFSIDGVSRMTADFLAAFGRDSGGSGDVVHFSEPPGELALLLLRDVLGIGRIRVL